MTEMIKCPYCESEDVKATEFKTEEACYECQDCKQKYCIDMRKD